MAARERFIIIGENIHCTRKVKRGGKRAKVVDGREVIVFTDEAGQERYMPIPPAIQAGDAYKSGMVPHVAAAVELGMTGSSEEQELAVAYLHWLARRQLERGADYLDVNVDEVSPDIEKRNAAMRWVVKVVQEVSDKPLSIDSSEVATLRAGLEAYDASKAGPAMLNSASLERLDVLTLAKEYGCPVILMCSSASGMPSGLEDRLSNAEAIVAEARKAGLQDSQMFVDPLIFPASASPETPKAVLEAMRQIHQRWPGVHVTGGHSNVSYGLPLRRLLNAVWLILAIEAGADSGLIDPVTCHPDDVLKIDRASKAFQMAKAGFLGEDPFFGEFIAAYRAGEISDPFASAGAT